MAGSGCLACVLVVCFVFGKNLSKRWEWGEEGTLRIDPRFDGIVTPF